MNAMLLLPAALLLLPGADRSVPPTLADAPTFTLVEPVSFTLDNGIEVLLVSRTRAPLIDVIANVDAGIASDPPELPGVANWTSAMLLEGAGTRDALAFADAESSLGADINAGTGIDSASVSLHVSRARFDEALALFADVLLRPRIEAADWRRVKQNLLGELIVQSQDPGSLAGLAAARAAWGKGHRFSLDASGTPRSLKGATEADVRAFFRARYRPDTTRFIVVGAIDKNTLQAKLNAAFGAWKAAGPRPVSPALAPPAARDTRVLFGVQVGDAPQTVLRVVAAAPPDARPFDAATDVMNTLLGGSFTSRLNDNLREQHGYAYGAASRLVYTRAGTLFAVRTAVQANATVPAVAEILGELERIKTPASAEEVARARNLTALSFPSAFDSGRSTAATWSEALSLGITAARIRTFLADAPRVDVAAVQSAAQRVVDPEHSAVVLVGDLRAHEAELSRFGPMEKLTAEDLLPGLADATP